MPMMNFEEFTDYTANNIKDYLPPEYQQGTVTIEQVRKLGGTYTGMMIRVPGISASPTINLEQFYKEFAKGSTTNYLLRNMAQVIMTSSLGEDYAWITDYEKAKDRLFIRVSNLPRNEEMMKSVPHVEKEDLVMTCHILVSMDRGVASTVVNDNLLKAYGINKEQLFHDAMESSQKLFPIRLEPLETMIFNIAAEEGYHHPINENNQMMVVTNEQTINGAATLFYPDTMDRIADLIDGDYYVIPSSIHEFLVIPESANVSYQHLESMLHEVNTAMVAEDEQLSDHVYHYDSIEKSFELAEDYALRIQMNESQLSNNFVM